MYLSRIPNSAVFAVNDTVTIGNTRQEDESDDNDINIIGTNNRIIYINGEESQPIIEPEWEDINLPDDTYEAVSAYGALRIQRLELF